MAPTPGVTLVFNKLPALNAEMKANAQAAVAKATHDIEAHIKTAMAEPKHGHTYGEHVASAPGEAPAIDTSTLVNSVQSDVKAMRGVVGISAEQGPVLDQGGVHVEPRPFTVPARDAAAPGFMHAMENLL